MRAAARDASVVTLPALSDAIARNRVGATLRALERVGATARDVNERPLLAQPVTPIGQFEFVVPGGTWADPPNRRPRGLSR